MSADLKNFLDFGGLTEYDGEIKDWSNSAEQVAYKTVAKSADGNNLLFFKKPNAVVGTDTPDTTIEMGASDQNAKINALANIVSATYNESTKTYTINGLDTTSKNTLVAAINELLGDIGDMDDLGDVTVGTGETAPTDVIEAILLLNGHIDGLADTVANLDGTATIATVSNNVVTIKGGVKQIAGEIENKTTLEAADVVLEEVAVTGAAADVSVADAGDKFTATNVEGVLAELSDAIADAVDASDVTCEESAGSGDILKVYSFYQGVLDGDDAATKASKKIVDVNIPKDYLVRSATIETVTVEDVPYIGAKVGDKYIDFVINTKDGSGTGTAQHIYIPLNDLVSVIQGSVGAEVTVTIGENNTIQASINKIDAAKIEYKAESSAGAGDSETVKQALQRIDGDASTPGSINKAKADVIGTSTDLGTANTVYGAKAYADNAVSTAVQELDTSSDVAIATYDSVNDTITIQNGVSESNGVIEQGSGDGIVIAPISSASIQSLFNSSASNSGSGSGE